jgi:hypothetical protein
MKPVKNFTQCSVTKSGKYIWNEDDTKFGMNVPAWRQIINDAICYDEKDCEIYCEGKWKGKYLNGKIGKKCFSYEILENICFVVQYDKLSDSYNFSGGCYANDETFKLVPAKIDELYKFDSIEMEIRDHNDPIVIAGKLSNDDYDFGQSYVIFIY